MNRLHAAFIVLVASSLLSCTTTPTRPEMAITHELPPPAPAMPLPSEPVAPPLLERLKALAPDADPGVLALALAARECAIDAGHSSEASRLAVIDYSLPSTSRRLWLFDLAEERLLQHEHVTHGQGSGGNFASRFSNVEGSHQTSLGLYRTAETYIGANGYSLRMDGLDPGFNDNARMRAIVIHGAWYAEPSMIDRQGRLGRSQGCPALRQGIARQVIDELKGDQLLFAYADDARWLQGSRQFACGGRDARRIIADARNAVQGGMSPVVTAAP
ncbi:murein L,D-transpeptidase catalytic domain family protein [Luteimonas sp. e5]